MRRVPSESPRSKECKLGRLRLSAYGGIDADEPAAPSVRSRGLDVVVAPDGDESSQSSHVDRTRAAHSRLCPGISRTYFLGRSRRRFTRRGRRGRVGDLGSSPRSRCDLEPPSIGPAQVPHSLFNNFNAVTLAQAAPRNAWILRTQRSVSRLAGMREPNSPIGHYTALVSQGVCHSWGKP